MAEDTGEVKVDLARHDLAVRVLDADPDGDRILKRQYHVGWKPYVRQRRQRRGTDLPKRKLLLGHSERMGGWGKRPSGEVFPGSRVRTKTRGSVALLA